MDYDPSPAPVRSRITHPIPLGLWLVWTLMVVGTAACVAWPALREAAPLDTLRLVITSGLVGVAGLLAMTVLEIHLAPWRFLD